MRRREVAATASGRLENDICDSRMQEDYFEGLADVIFVGEAETTWPQFLEEWAQERHRHRYEQLEPTDMTRVPVPRYDLLKTKNYLFGSIQFTRGCHFQCEFCDIIVTFGRKPRLKTSAQVIAELEAMRKQNLLTPSSSTTT